MLSPEALRAAVAKLHWYHSIDLGNGIVTPGIDDTPRRLSRIGLPADLRGASVLDVGAWDGFFSFEAERRGAGRVLATDHFCWGGAGWGTKDGFELARAVLTSQVEDIEVDVLDLSPQRVGVFDVVLFLGLLYHTRHPLLALERIFAVTRDLLIVETVVDLLSCRGPAVAFYPDSELYGDRTNWWGPNPAAVTAMLQSVGFSRVEVVSSHRSLPARAGRALWERARSGQPFRAGLQRDRVAFHAWR